MSFHRDDAAGRAQSGAFAPSPASSHDYSSNSTKQSGHPVASAFNVPGHAIYIADPHRFGVLLINIDATTTIVTSSSSVLPRTAPVSPNPQASRPPLSPSAYRNASTSKLGSPQPPPSSFQHPFTKSGRSRPLSQEFGQKARDVLNEFGRLASRRASALERAGGAETLARVADGLSVSSHNHSQNRRATLQPASASQNYLSSSVNDLSRPPPLRLASDEPALIRSALTQNLVLVPQNDPRRLSSTVPLDIHSRITGSGISSSQHAPIAFVADSQDQAEARSDAGPAPREARATFDPSCLLLKVSPPAELARETWAREASSFASHDSSQHETSESHDVNLRFRLRLEGHAANTRIDKSGGSGKILFLSASHTRRLIDAIESPQSSIATAELASLEGISRVELPPPTSPLSANVSRGARECDFDWSWKTLARSASQAASRCCCAFVELHPDGASASVLAAFSFVVDMPSSTSPHASSLRASALAPPVKAEMSRSDSLALIAALNLGQDLSVDSDVASPSPALQAGLESAAASPALERSQLNPQGGSLPVPIDRTELALEDVVSDSPIFRAALGNLERRTASIKKLSKALLKAVQESQARLAKLLEAEGVMDAAFDDLVGIAPETLGRMQDHFLRQARAKSSQHRREHVDTIEACLERPLLQLIELCRAVQDGLKRFDNESKTYYSQTQKWLANRSDASASTQPHSDPPYQPALEKAHKQERTDEKQKLREMRFEQARLDLFLVLQRLHGGRAEVNLAQRVLQLSRWYADSPTTIPGAAGSDDDQKRFLSGLEAALQNALDGHASKLDQAEARSRQIGDKIRALEVVLGKAADADIDVAGTHKFEAEQETPQAQHPGAAVVSKARKLKSFLGAFASNMNPSPLTNSRSPLVGSAMSQQESDQVVSSANESIRRPSAQRRLSLKLRGDRDQPRDASPASPLRSQAPSSWKYDALSAHSRRGSEPRDFTGVTDPDSSSRSSSALPLPDISAANPDRGLGIYAASPQPSPRTAGTNQMPGPVPPSPANTNSAVGGDRKKEGVLWVMSKPISGPAGADAPRGVSRSTHWRECWVVLSGSGQISEFADWKNAKALEPTNPLIDLRFATVREARGVDRRFTFEIVTRDSRRFFQAPDEETMRDWMRAIARAIESLLNGTSSVRKLDRAVRASPFANLDVAQRAGAFDEKEEDARVLEGDDFAVRRLLDRTTKPFSQSMTDLSSPGKASNGDRKGERTKIGAHLVTLSESQAEPGVQLSKRASRHQRGISNKTPISGYLGSGGLGLSAADAAAWHRRSVTGASDDASSSSHSAKDEHETEFDRQIEAVIQRSYGSHGETGASHSGFSHASAQVDEMGMLKGDPSRRTTAPNSSFKGHNGSVASASFGTKESRAAELAAISRRPENQRCADCQSEDPRWASWMLANEACCIFICIGCSGVHRSLGVHISKVKSVDLDDWTQEQLQAARDWGNARANAVWEHSKPAGRLPAPGDRTDFWRTKYVEQQWKAPAPAQGETKPQLDRAEDVDATPTRQSVGTADRTARAPNSPPPDVFVISSQLQSRPAGAGAAAEPLGSPRPNGPRPLPSRRSVSMQSIPTTSPPQSPVGPGRAFAARDLTSPASPTRRAGLDWNGRPDVQTREAVSNDQSAPILPVLIHSPTKEALQHRRVVSGTADAHVSEAMLAARADPRLFPYDVQRARAGEHERVSVPPSSFFVSNLDGDSPSPILFEDAPRGGSGSDTDADASGEHRFGPASPHQPPARFEAYTTAN
ncbi:uncharacterized protein PSANT_03641 [Moesziomyces antarcticus]|nr:uncharacterized protein PSANT_03641 [Moesziomyces antarcticus]